MKICLYQRKLQESNAIYTFDKFLITNPLFEPNTDEDFADFFVGEL